jgi:hypothetical protein
VTVRTILQNQQRDYTIIGQKSPGKNNQDAYVGSNVNPQMNSLNLGAINIQGNYSGTDENVSSRPYSREIN